MKIMTYNIQDKFGIEVSTYFPILISLELFLSCQQQQKDSFFWKMLYSNAMIPHMSTDLPL